MKSILTSLAALFAGAAAFAHSQPPAELPKDGYTIDNCVNTFDPSRSEVTSRGFQYWFADRKFAHGNTVKLSVVRAGQASHSPHRHGEEEFFFVLEGKAEFYLDGARRTVGPMTSLYAPSGHEHGIRNAGDTDLKYLVLKKYSEAP